MYVQYMQALGRDEGVEMRVGEGVVAGTLGAHRVLFVIQEEFGNEMALKVLESLYTQYFVEAKHPSSPETLRDACLAAGLSAEQAGETVEDEERGMREVKASIREQAMDGVDSVPYVVFEGRKRDFTLVGAKGVGEYVRTLEQVGKEAV